MAIKRDDFPLPDTADTLTEPFYAAAAREELCIPRCTTCREFVWYPEAVCPRDGGVLEWTQVSGRASLFSWVVVHRAFLPAFEAMVPFVTALVALEEDPAVRIPTYIVDADPESFRTVDPGWSPTLPGRRAGAFGLADILAPAE